MEKRIAPGNPASISVPLHIRAHPSDLLSKFLVQWCGQDKYGSGASPTGHRIVMVGRGGYDEHDRENIPFPDPKRKECEATLVARDLGVENLPELKPILEYIRWADVRGEGKGKFKFARLVELLHDVYPEEPWIVEQFTWVLVRASIEAERGAREGQPFKSVPAEVVGYFIKKAYAKVEPEFRLAVRVRLEEERIRKWFEPSGLVDFKPFSLPHCIVLLWQRFGKFLFGERLVVEWVADAFRAEFVRQSQFLGARREAEREIIEHGQLGEVILTIHDKEAIAYLIHSDSPRISSFFLSQDYSKSDKNILVAVRRSNGQVQIFRRRHGAVVDVRLNYVVAFLRAWEQERRGVPVAVWEELVTQRGEHWYYGAGPEWIFNGSLTEPDVEPTVLSDREILEAIAHGLDDYYQEFRREFRLARAA